MFIFLCGFMGSGKSYLLQKLSSAAAQAKTPPEHQGEKILFADLDQWIWQKEAEGYSQLADFIKDRGWEHFRACEHQSLQQILRILEGKETGEGEESEGYDHALIALGGGALTESFFTWLEQRSDAALVWPDTPFDDCYARILLQGEGIRPLLSLGREKLQELYDQRKKIYQKSTVSLSPREIDHLGNFFDLVTYTTKSHNN